MTKKEFFDQHGEDLIKCFKKLADEVSSLPCTDDFSEKTLNKVYKLEKLLEKVTD